MIRQQHCGAASSGVVSAPPSPPRRYRQSGGVATDFAAGDAIDLDIYFDLDSDIDIVGNVATTSLGPRCRHYALATHRRG
jgi:hypothetical protein